MKVFEACAAVSERRLARRQIKTEKEERTKRDASRIGCMYFLLEDAPVNPQHVKIGCAQGEVEEQEQAEGGRWSTRPGRMWHGEVS